MINAHLGESIKCRMTLDCTLHWETRERPAILEGEGDRDHGNQFEILATLRKRNFSENFSPHFIERRYTEIVKSD